MLFLEWKNKRIGSFDVFAVLNETEKDALIQYFGTSSAESVSWEGKYYYFIDLEHKTITPMPELYLAFGGQYNTQPPYGNKISDFAMIPDGYKLLMFENEECDD
ncbi:MAG: hypothetical protein IKM31_09190 [Oscillospiraceae bacterium]|nr:hypothetical protein [Oscillospiraceae bacterium]